MPSVLPIITKSSYLFTFNKLTLMRKITLAAIASLTVTAAVGATPQIVDKSELQTVKAELTAVQAVSKMNFDPADRTEGTLETAIPSTTPLYVTKNAFWLGMTQDRSSYRGKFGFTASKGNLIFQNNAYNPTAQTWYLEEFLGYEGTGEDRKELMDSIISDDKDLVVKLNPFNSMLKATQYMSPVLVVDTVGGSYQYNDSVVEYLVGRSAYSWGFPDDSEVENPDSIKISEMVGMTGVLTTGNKWFSGTEMGKTIGGKGFNENGVYESYWTRYLPQGAVNIGIDGFGTKVPAQAAPFHMLGTYAWISTVATAETHVEATVYALTADGKVDFEEVLGKGNAVIPNGTFNDPLLFELHAVNVLGLETDSPVAVPAEGCFIAFSGFSAATITKFNPIINGNEYCKASNYQDEVWDEAYPYHAYFNFTYEDAEGESYSTFSPIYALYGAGDDNEEDQTLTFAREFAVYYIVEFPIVVNAATGSPYFEYDAPAEGGEVVYYVRATYDIDQLIKDEEMTDEATAEWFTYEVGYDEEEELTTVTVTVPANTESTARTGEITFTGYACDFTITVNQAASNTGEENSISEINVAANGAAEYFDLQGRKLNAAPAQGVYIQRVGSTSSKLVK